MTEKNVRSRISLPGIRPYIQLILLHIFIIIFFKVSYPFHDDFSKNFFFNLDPLITFIMVLSGSPLNAALLVSIATVIVTVLFGKVFCGWICPMGTILDYSAKMFPRRKKENIPFGKGRYKNIKYFLLVFLVAGSAMGFTVVLFFDPIVFLFRVMTLNIHPFMILIANQGLNVIRPLAMKAGMFQLSMMSFEQPVFRLGLANLFLFTGVIGLIALEHRFWCRNLCPLGAMLSLLSKFSLWGRRVSDKCTSCSKCARTCPMNAISEDFTDTSARECIQCESCKTVCPEDAITFETGKADQRFEFNPARRGVIFSGIGGILTGFAAASAVTTQTVPDKRLRPPGALVENDFMDTCLRCSECMKVCPTHGLQPAMLQAGFEGLFTPVLTPRIGGCEEQCNLCGQVCPTGAVRALSLVEKQYAVIGNAIIDRNRCIAWEQGKLCLICDEVCPYDAIEFLMVTDEKATLQRPYVIEDKCVGCGQCEHGCPVNGPAAIFVTPVNEVRKNDGSYITEKVKQLREEYKFDDEKDFYKEDSLNDAGTSGESAPKPWETNVNPDSDLPPGFVE